MRLSVSKKMQTQVLETGVLASQLFFIPFHSPIPLLVVCPMEASLDMTMLHVQIYLLQLNL